MILGVRKYKNGTSKGINIFLYRSWTLPIDEMGLDCFQAFDASLAKFEIDDEATIITPIGKNASSSIIERQIQTSTQAAISVLPIRFRKFASLWTLHFRDGKLISNLPNWAHLCVENNEGNIYNITTSKQSSWTSFETKKEETWAHLTFFGPLNRINLNKLKKPRFMRLSTLIEAQSLLDAEGASLSLYKEEVV